MVHTRPNSRALIVTLGSTLIACTLSGCGKPLTLEDCERIVARVTELELQQAEVSDTSKVENQVAQTKSTFKQRALDDCVGRRLPASAMQCVEQATSARQIVEECFD